MDDVVTPLMATSQIVIPLLQVAGADTSRAGLRWGQGLPNLK